MSRAKKLFVLDRCGPSAQKAVTTIKAEFAEITLACKLWDVKNTMRYENTTSTNTITIANPELLTLSLRP